MANRSTKLMLSARVSTQASELLRVIRRDCKEPIPVILERALLAMATDKQIEEARSSAELIEREARIEKAANTLKKQLPGDQELQEALERLSGSRETVSR